MLTARWAAEHSLRRPSTSSTANSAAHWLHNIENTPLGVGKTRRLPLPSSPPSGLRRRGGGPRDLLIRPAATAIRRNAPPAAQTGPRPVPPPNQQHRLFGADQLTGKCLKLGTADRPDDADTPPLATPATSSSSRQRIASPMPFVRPILAPRRTAYARPFRCLLILTDAQAPPLKTGERGLE